MDIDFKSQSRKRIRAAQTRAINEYEFIISKYFITKFIFYCGFNDVIFALQKKNVNNLAIVKKN